ncbi:MAG: SGNH/GDSL hydrolase family protein [Acidimicrobiia bacterium]
MTYQPRRLQPRRRSPAGHVLLAVVVALGLGSLLNARSLERTAENLPYGTTRSVAVAVAGPLRSISSFLYLDRPRQALDSLVGRSTADPEPPIATSPGSTTPSSTSTTSSTIPDQQVPLRTPTADDPLKVWIIGDSLMELLGPSIVNEGDQSGVIDAEVDFRFVSGLTRRDFFDWPAYAAEQLPVVQPDVVIGMFGGNDGQDANVDGVIVERWTPEWIEFYGGRVGEAMDAFTSEGSRLYWIALPIMANDLFSDHVQLMNDVYREEAAKRPAVFVIESWDLFTDESGNYSAYLASDSGTLELMRYGDGVHFTWAGAARLAAVVFDQMHSDWSGE